VPFDLERFIKAQDASVAGYADALQELRTDGKRGHWIWYVFPQLSGLGSSSASEFYGIDGRDEADAYLQHPVLRKRLLEVTAAVAERLERGDRLKALMGSHIDALKVVSSLTLFHDVAERLGSDADESTDLRQFATVSNAVLRASAAQGYPPCRRTIEALHNPN
jgi:uncharacterized protein (DUF1810 family)